jgi:hypothetical protein
MQVEAVLPEAFLMGGWQQLPADAAMTVTAPGHPPLRVPLAADTSSLPLRCAASVRDCHGA